MKCIIPAAGYGTRMSMAMNKSKEMLVDSEYHKQPIIQYVLDLCKAFKMEPLVITREDKKDLRQYLFNQGVKFIDIDVKGEWNESVLASKDHWDQDNLLILPDTRFKSLICIEDIRRGLELGNNAVMALHEVTDPSKWGIITPRYVLLEKPDYLPNDTKYSAWGLIGFKKSYGQELFSDIEYPKELKNVGFTYLKNFEDITRGDK